MSPNYAIEDLRLLSEVGDPRLSASIRRVLAHARRRDMNIADRIELEVA